MSISKESNSSLVENTGQEPRRLVDLSHAVEDGMITYKGLPAPIVCDFLSREASRDHYAEGTEFHIGKIKMVANTGTYLDAPFHRYDTGKDLAELPLTSLAELPAVVVRPTSQSIGVEVFESLEVKGKAVLIYTGWSTRWRTDAYFEGHPFLNEEAAVYLREQQAALVGIDSLNIDSTQNGARPVYSTLLGADIPIVEHLTNLREIPEAGCLFSAVPVKVVGMGTFPVRAYASIPES